jgi:[ribosomal protein S18]-alanine N-acetyltransferase
VRIRVASPADVDLLVALEEVCEGADAWSRGLVAEGVAGLLPTTTWLITEAGDGYAVVAVVDDVAELQRIGVAPAGRRTGIASALLDRVVAHARGVGAVRLLLEVREDNEPARALYARAGVAEIARRRRYYADGATALVLQLDV